MTLELSVHDLAMQQLVNSASMQISKVAIICLVCLVVSDALWTAQQQLSKLVPEDNGKSKEKLNDNNDNGNEEDDNTTQQQPDPVYKSPQPLYCSPYIYHTLFLALALLEEEKEEEEEEKEEEKSKDEEKIELEEDKKEEKEDDYVTYKVEAIVDQCLSDDGTHMLFLVKWHGWLASANTWEPISTLCSCLGVYEHFLLH